MIGRVKQWLGIEGVKLELVVPEEVDAATGTVSGRLRFHSMNTQEVTYIVIRMLERYTRGRSKDKLVDEYQLGELEVSRLIEIPAGHIVEVPFTLPFKTVRSDMDEMERNILIGGLAKAAKLVHGVKSEYRVEAEAKVKGTALNPFDRKVLKLK